MQTDVFLPEDQFWVLVIGSIVPVFGYLQNKLWPDMGESFKGIVQVALTAAVGALYTVVATDVTGFDEIAQQCFSAVVAALLAHNILWKPANVNVKVGARPSPTQTPKGGERGGRNARVPGAGMEQIA